MSRKKEVLKNLIEYQKDSIVSRTLIEKIEGSVTLFSFDAGQSLKEHTTPFDALAYLIEGEGTFVIEGEEHILKEGEMIIMPPNIPHAIDAIKKLKFLLIMIKAA